MPTSEQIAHFRNSVTPDLYDVQNYINWPDLEERITRCLPAIEFLRQRRRRLSARTLGRGLRDEPALYEVVSALLAIPRGAGFSDGRELPDPVSPIRSDFQ